MAACATLIAFLSWVVLRRLLKRGRNASAIRCFEHHDLQVRSLSCSAVNATHRMLNLVLPADGLPDAR